MQNGINKGLGQFPPGSGLSADQSTGAAPAGKAGASDWKKTDLVDFQGNMLQVAPTENPFWNGLGAAVSSLGGTLMLHVGALFNKQ